MFPTMVRVRSILEFDYLHTVLYIQSIALIRTRIYRNSYIPD